MIKASICTIGDEILIGQIIDTNSSHIALGLNSIGVQVNSMCSISDRKKEILFHLDSLLAHNEIVIVTGGLGPTKDDITKSALAELYGDNTFSENAGQLSIIQEIFRKRGGGKDISKLNRLQASVPNGSEVILNQLGTAPGMIFRFSQNQYKHRPTLYSLPGVPFEALGMLPEMIEDIKTHNPLEDIYHQTILTFGFPESTLSDMLETWEEALAEDIHLAYLPNPNIGVRLRLSIYGGNKEDSISRIAKEFEMLKPILGNNIYGKGGENLQMVIGRFLKEKELTISVAESCTGGRIASMLTSTPGSSAYFLGSVTAYDYSIKEDLLKVNKDTLIKYGAVSKNCVEEMASGVRTVINTDVSIATSGIAGPDGGTEDKPVGTVWIAISLYCRKTGEEKIISKKLCFNGDRERNIERFASSALNILRLGLIDFY